MIAAILTGGASSRFGTDKALVMGGGVRDAARDLGCDPVVAVGGTAGPALGLITIPDRRPGAGPLAALASVLLWAGPEHVLVLPCDLPLLTGDHLRPLVDAARHPDTAVIAEVGGSAAHSVGVWPGSAGRRLWQAVERGERALQTALDLVQWVAVPLDPSALRDADTAADLALLEDEALCPPSTPSDDSA